MKKLSPKQKLPKPLLIQQKQKRYNSAADIIGSPEFEKFQENLYKIDDDSIIAKIAKKRGIKLKKRKIDFSRNIMMDIIEFYNSPENEIE